VVSTTLDPDGRKVASREERWAHILSRRPGFRRYLPEIMQAVREPTVRMAGHQPGEEWFLLEGAGPARWSQVVVHFEGGEGWIATAFPQRSLPRR
jgi:hypothetical protein